MKAMNAAGEMNLYLSVAELVVYFQEVHHQVLEARIILPHVLA